MKNKKPPVKQTPRESLVPGNKRVKAPSGKSSWLMDANGNRAPWAPKEDEEDKK